MGIQNKCFLKIGKMRLMGMIILTFIPVLLFGQTNESFETRKGFGLPTLTVDVGLFVDASIFSFGQSQGFIIGVEKRKQRLIIGPTFGLNMYYSKPELKYGLTGFVADYSLILFHTDKQLDLAIFAQFQYNYQDRVDYYEPPAESLILSSQYQESIYGLIGIDARVNFRSNFQFFVKVGAGIESRTTQTHYPYYPPFNKYKKNMVFAPRRLIGLAFRFPVKKKFPEQ